MATTMAHVLRAQKRDWLREATAIFLGFDDKNGRKLLRFKAETPSAAPSSCSDAEPLSWDPTYREYGARMGIVGCMPAGLHYDLADYERDYAEKTASEVGHMIERLCKPAGDTVDSALLDGVLLKIKGIVVDGALLKTAHFLKATKMPNICIILRDPAHVIRPSVRDPLHDADQFKAQNDRLFGNRHAVLKEFQNSCVWKDQLEASQREMNAACASTPGSGDSVAGLLRHFDFVQPRFESFVAPRRRYVCLVRAIAHVLATKAGDWRLKPAVRQRAEAALEAMRGGDCFTAGLAGDYGEVCLEFLRIFDVDDHDPARAFLELKDFIAVLRALFVKGYVVCDAGEVQLPGVGIRKTLTQIAVENIREPLLIR